MWFLHSCTNGKGTKDGKTLTKIPGSTAQLHVHLPSLPVNTFLILNAHTTHTVFTWVKGGAVERLTTPGAATPPAVMVPRPGELETGGSPAVVCGSAPTAVSVWPTTCTVSAGCQSFHSPFSGMESARDPAFCVAIYNMTCAGPAHTQLSWAWAFCCWQWHWSFDWSLVRTAKLAIWTRLQSEDQCHCPSKWFFCWPSCLEWI